MLLLDTMVENNIVQHDLIGPIIEVCPTRLPPDRQHRPLLQPRPVRRPRLLPQPLVLSLAISFEPSSNPKDMSYQAFVVIIALHFIPFA